jgi:thiamine pyrophosphokinase
MKTAVLITPICQNVPCIENADYIGVDAGGLKIIEQGLPLTISLGDFDSMPQAKLALLEAAGPCQSFPIEKDETDTELALLWCKDKYDRIILAGGLGGRLDHTLANLSLMIHRYSKQLVLLSKEQQAFVLEKGKHEIQGDYKHVSFFALEPACISIQGLKYETNERKLYPDEIYAVSNSFAHQNDAQIDVHEGRLLCVMSNKA